MPGPLEVVIGLDAGTTSAKLVAIDRSGRIVATSTSDTIVSVTSAPGSSVQSPEGIWSAITSACRRGIAELADSAQVVGVAVASQSGSVVPIVDGHATEVITWMDTRSDAVVDAWPRPTIELIRRRSGWARSTGLGLATISWLRSLGTAEQHRGTRYGSVDDYLIWQLTGAWLTNPSNAAGMQLMDVSQLEWSPELCALAGITPSALSAIRPCGDLADVVTASAALATGLPTATSVTIGGHDQACAALGLGAVQAGAAVLSMGTAWVLTIVTDQVDFDNLPVGFNLSPHVVSQRWSISQNLGGLGAALAWVIDDADSDQLEAELGARTTMPDDPFFVSEMHLADRTGWGRFTQHASSSDPVARVRAVMEALAFETRRAVDQAADSAIGLTELAIVGGGTRSRYLTQLVADVLGVSVTIRPDASWPALGAAKLAAIAGGWSNPSSADLPSLRVSPRTEQTTTTDCRFSEYLRLTSGATT